MKKYLGRVIIDDILMGKQKSNISTINNKIFTKLKK